MDNIVVADKQTEVATQSAWGNINLKGPGVVQMPVAPDQLATVTQRGQDLVLTLKSGEKITIGNFFAVDQAGVGSDIVFVGEDGTLWHAQYNAAAFEGFTFEDVNSLDELVAGLGTAGSAMPTWAIAGLSLLGAGGAAAAAGSGGGGGGGGADPDTTPPATPIDLLVSPDGLRLTGRAEAGSTVTVRGADGAVLGTAVAGADGQFSITLQPAQTDGQALEVSASDAAGNVSPPASINAPDIDTPDTTAPDQPSDLALANGVTLSGRGEPGATLQVRDTAGNLIGSGVVNADGTFSLTLSPAQANGEALDIRQVDAAGNSSTPLVFTAPDITAPAAPSALVVSQDGTVLTGRAEPGSTIRILAADGSQLGTALVGATGVFSINLSPAQVDGQTLQATATDAAGNTSTASSVTAPSVDGGDTTPPQAPSDLAIGLAGSQLSGRGEAGSTVQVRDAAGTVIATGTVGADGTFVISLDPAVKDGSTLQVTLTDAAGNVSQPGAVTSPDLLPPAQPTDLTLADGVTFTGRGEPGATVQVRDAAGNLLGSAVVNQDGTFSLSLSPAQANGEALDVRLVDAAGNSSPPLQFNAPDITAPDAVSDILVGAGGTRLSGHGEAGASVEVRDADGNLLGRGVVTANGTFLIDLDPAVQPGDQLTLLQVDPSGNASVAVEYDVPLTTAPASPSGLAIDADGTTLTGSAPAGSRVEVRDASGTLIGSAVANADGSFSIELTPAQANGELLNVLALDAEGVSSVPTQITAPDITAPAAPAELAVSADGSVITGRAEPGSTVRIVAADGTELGSAVVGPTGAFSIELAPPQTDGEVLQATATDAAGNTSATSAVTAPDLDGVDTTPPAAPTDLAIALAGSQLSGRGEPGASVQVRDAAGNILATGSVGADGSFTITLDPPVNDGTALQVTLTDAAGNQSPPGSVTSPDLQPPAPPTELALLGGVTFNGRGEPGATVQVRDAAGTLIGSGVVGADGAFSLSLSPAQANGEALDVRLVDAAGNSSTPLEFTAPDTTPPAAVSNIVVGADGLALSGRGEAGATVEVRDADGTVIGSGVVSANGTFLIDLEPAVQPGAQLSLVQTDPSGNASEALEFAVPTTPAPASPSDLVVAEDGSSISGTAPAGTRVEVHDANGTLLGSGVAGDDGSFTVTLEPAQANGELLDVVAIDGSGASSLPAQISAPDITPPVTPSELVISADGSVLTGRAEAGSTVRVLAADGTTVLGTAVVGATGSFSITLDPAQVNGEVLQVTATDNAGNASAAGTVTAPDIDGGDNTAPLAPTDLVIGLAGGQLSGRGEPGTRVEVRDAQGNVLANGTVNPDGSFVLTLSPAVDDGSALQVTLTDAAGNVSQPGTVTAPDLQAPAQPTDLALADGVTFTGRGEPGATVQVRNADGTVIGSGVVGADGAFSLSLSPAQANGEALDVRLVDAAGNSSMPLAFTAPDTTPPAAVSDIVVGADGLALSGRGEAGATVEVRDADGTVIGSGVVAANGVFLIDLNPGAQPGAQLSLVQTDPSGNTSEALQFEVPVTPAPASPSDLIVAEDGSSISGAAPAGSRVEVYGADGTLVGSVQVGQDGTFTVILNPAQANGELLEVVAIDGSGASSLPAQVSAPDITPPVTPSELVISADGSVVTGRAEVGSTVRVLAADGTTVLGTAVVGATGSFSITLDPAQLNGEVLQVTATDAAGNASTAGTVTAPDIDGGDNTPPEAATNLLVGLAGAQLSGRGEAGASVQVRDAQGNVLANGTVNPDGSFTLALEPAVKDGSTLQVVLTDAAGNASAPASVVTPDLQAPAQPTGLALVDGVTLSGSGEPGASVQVRNAAGTLLGSAQVNDDGTFSVTLTPAQANGEVLDIRLVDAAGNISSPLQYQAPDTTAPAQVSDIVVGADGLALSGRGEAGATVQVRDANGTLIGSGVVTANGTFLLDLDPPALPGERLSLVQTDPSGNASLALDYDVPLVTVPLSPSDLVVAEDGTSVSGSAPVGSRVEVHDAEGALIGSVVVGAEGTFTVVLNPAQANGQLLDVVAIDNNGTSSLPVQVSAPDITPPVAPSELAITADGTAVSGRAEPGSTVRVLAADGSTVLGTVVVGASGAFEITLSPAQANGELLDVVAIDADGNSSLPTQISAPDITPPNEASELQLSNDGSVLTGRGEPGTRVQVVDAQGNVLGNAQVGADGVISVVLNPAQTDGQELDVVLRDAAGNSSTATVIAPDLDGPLQPSALAIDSAGIHLTGQGQSGSLVTVRDADGNVLGTATVGGDGRFDVTLNAPQRNGESLTVEATDSQGNSAGPVDFTAPDSTPPQAVTNPAIDGDGVMVTGNGEPGATVTVRGPDGSVLGSIVVGAGGAFEISLDTPQTNGQALTVEQRDASGNLSTAVDLSAPDTQAPDTPTGLVLAGDGGSLSGSGEPGAQVTVTGAGGAVLGTATVQTDGSFQVTIDPPQLNGQTLAVTQADATGNTSTAGSVTAPDLEAPVAAEGLGINGTGTALTGQAEPGSTVQVRNGAGDLLGSAQVEEDGSFSVPLAPAQTNGETVSVVVVDAGGNTSPSVAFTADDSTAPQAPGGLTISAGGDTVQGTGEAGSTVEVRNAAGVLLGSVVVPVGGSFTVAVSPAQLDGQALQVTLTDVAGNVSDSTPITAPDLTPPALPTGVVVSEDGSTVSGNAPGADTVTVRDGAGVETTVEVNPDGSFNVPLPTPQNNGESVTVIVTDPAGNSSAPVTVTAPDTTDPEAASGVTVSPDGSSVGGTAEPGSTVVIRNPDNSDRGTTTAGPDGTFVVPVDPPLAAGEEVSVVVIDPAGNESDGVTLTGPTGSEVATPADLAISADGFVLTGTGTVGALITVTSAGTTLGTATVGSDGVFRVFFSNAQLNAQTLQVSARIGADGQPSVPATVVANDTTAPEAPSATIDRTGSTLTGQGEVGANVRVTDAQGNVLGSGVVGSNGLYSITLSPAAANGQNLIVTQADAAGNVSLAASLQAPDLQAPAAASNLSLNAAATVVSGQGEAGASVTVRDASGAILATGTVNQSGQFQITLPSAQVSGSPLQVTLSDAAGNVSGPASLATPDRTPPAAIADPLLSADGRQLSGSGEVGATVQVSNAAGTVLGSATVGADGRFTVTFDTPQNSGQAIGVTQVDAAGNTSPAVNVATPDLTPPAPLTNVVLNNNGLTLSGLGEAGASVTVRGPDGTIIGTGLVAANGSFSLTLTTAQLNAQQLSVTQTDAGNNTSSAVAVTAPDFTPPAAPTALALSATGLQLTGNAEAGSTVTVRDAGGSVLGSAVASSNGTFQVTLNSAQTNGQTLQVTATDAAGNVSPAAPYTAADTTPPAAVSNLAVSADGATLTGQGEAGATVTVRAPDATILGTATVAADGSFSVALSPAALTGERLAVVQTDAAQNASPEQNVTAPGILAPATPDNLVLAADGLSVTGTATAGSTVTVYGPNGAVLGSSPVANDGTFTVNLGSAQANGEVLHVSAMASDGSLSLPATLQAPDTTAPQPLSNLVLSSDGLVLTGRGEPGATVTVVGEGGIDLGTAVVDANGNFSATLGSVQLNGEQLSASQADAAGNESNSVSITAPDRVAPDAAADLAFAGGGSLLNGSGEAGASVWVMAADGSVLGTAVVRADGSFQVVLASPQANGQPLQVLLTDAAGNQSAASTITAPDTTPPAAPSDLAVSGDGVTLTGRGEVGAEVTVTDPSGAPIGSAIVDASGHFTITLNPALGNAELLSFTQADAAGNVSAAATLQTPDFTPPAPLTQVAINADGSVVTGLGEAGATVIVSNAAGSVLGTATVLADGSFSVVLSPAQIDNQVLSVLQADPPGNVSAPVSVQAPDFTPPAAATELRLNAAGDVLTGVGEAGTTVRVYVGTTQIGTTTVAADGTFSVGLDTAQLNGQQVQVTLTDASDNVSPISTVTAVDVTPPAIVIASINDSGTQLIGTAEAGTRVTVINNNGDLLGQVTVDLDGTFVLGLSQPQINGETLTIIAQDATGNPSAPLELSAPDLTAPVQPSDLLLNPAGTSMTGTAEAGTLITVRGPDNTLVGQVEVGADGRFTVPISPAQNNGQLLSVVSTDDAGNVSVAAPYQANDTSPPDLVTNLAINNTFNVLTGKGEANATVTVSLGGSVLGTGTVDAAGNFQITLTPAAGSLATLAITQSDGINTSAVATYVTPLVAPPVPPTNVTLGSDGLTLSGNAPSGVGIRVYDAAGNLIGTGGATLNGTFTLTLNSAQLNGEYLQVTAVALVGGESQPTFLQAADTTAPSDPLVTSLSTNGLVLSGTGEAGATVTVRDAGGNVLGSAVVNGGGVYAVNLNAAQLNGQVLAVSQADVAGNTSGSTRYTAADLQPPALPTNVTINGAGTVVTGNGEAGATVTVQGANGSVGSGVVQADGTFSITLTTPQNDGQLLVVRQADAAGNLSSSVNLNAPDTTPPAAPLATINTNGTMVSGSGQVGSTVTVRNSAGTVLGTATVGSTGLFVVSLNAAQIDNQALSVTLTDSAGNESTGTALTAPDLTPPAAAANLAISADGSTLTGTGEVGATVTVRSASGTVLQTATVQADGSFTVTLSPPQDNGQVLAVTLSDPRGNVSGNASITAPDVDANAPVIASDNLATATVDLAAVTASRTYTDSFTTLLAGFTKTYTWTVAAGTTADPTLTLTTSSALALLDNTTFTLQVKNASGTWVTLATGNSQGLLDLILLPLGQGLRVDIGVLQAGDYRLTVGSGGIGLITNVSTSLDITSTSLTEFTGTGTATSGNVITDVGTDGVVDARGPDSAAVLQVLKGGSYVSAGSATTVQGLYGTLVIRGDGSYTYTPNGSPASVGKVDVFSYQLVHPNGLSDSANLYVRIDSPQATEVWSDSNYAAPATVLDAVNDVGFSNLTLANRVDTSSSTLGSLTLPLIGSRQATYTTTVAADTTANLQVVLNSANLLSLLNGTTLELLKLNPATGQYVLVQSVGGGSLISLLGGGAGYTFQNQGAGTYHVRVTAGGIGLASSITTSVNATTTHLNEFVVSGATAATGNLLADDTLGSALTVLSVLTAANTYTIPGYNGVSVAGTYGTLLVQADGSYTYTLNSGVSAAAVGQHDTFTYELTHPNGSTDTATLTINLDNAAGLVSTTSLLADSGEEAVALASVATVSDVVAGSDGNDHLVGSQGGHITLEGGAGDDTLVIVDQNFASVDGGTGTDTLQWGGGDVSIDLGNLVGRVHGIEAIDLNDTSAVALTLNLADVVAITETGTDTLIIKGDNHDSVHMTDNWNLVGNQTADGIDYNQYTAQEDPSHHLWVQNGIHVV
ncbi:BapA/Bap/LapF family large adhesin [Pseudomonas juntendi]|uniref:BapA/Bap/LapF family large adhesin n=1 Tax=Pseudomonas juntendi TaxID=2666183 RepID=UPI00244D023F|nr:BapA/Bap/LapF family large adhesin [Pseudomonas juntendi]MDG9890784.1 Ig-like domain-containing protein [Pseudomonas juntendi]